jgi:pimeloyl-ACP methyl ester carboxylesterase
MNLSQRLALNYIRTKFKLLSAISKKKAAKKAFELFCTPQRRNKKPLPKIFEQAEKLQFRLESCIVRGWRWNPVRTGLPGGHPAKRKLLILHGYESSVTNFDRYVRLFIEKGYEVLAFDAPAHGRSDGKKISAPLYKKMIREIHKKYGPVESYLAHSFGGLAVSLALEEINHTPDYRLALIAPAAETSTAVDNFFKLLKLDPLVRIEFEKIIIKAGGVHAEWYSIRRAMKHIRAKVRWFQDEDDAITPMSDVLKVKEENYPNVEFVITKGLGHRRIYRDNKITGLIVDFL